MSFNDPNTTPQPYPQQPPVYGQQPYPQQPPQAYPPQAYPPQPYPAAPGTYPVGGAYPPVPAPQDPARRVAGIVLTVIGGLFTVRALATLGNQPLARNGNLVYMSGYVFGRLIPVALLVIGIILLVHSRRK